MIRIISTKPAQHFALGKSGHAESEYEVGNLETLHPEKKIKENGGDWFMGEMAGDNVYYEMKFSDPNGTIFDITHTGWGGARKEGPPPEGDE